MRTVLQHKTVRFLLVVAVAVGGFTGYGRLSAPWRIDPALAAGLAKGGYADIAVVVPFLPEQFHVNLFQQVGTVRGVRGNVVLIGRVPVDEVRRLAHYYWIRRIEPMSAAPAG